MQVNHQYLQEDDLCRHPRDVEGEEVDRHMIIPAHHIFAARLQDKCYALPMFHAITWCDTSNVPPDVTRTFSTMMGQRQMTYIEDLTYTLERFVVLS